MIETIVPIGYLHLINAILCCICMFTLVFFDLKKHSEVNYERVIFYTFIFFILSSFIVYSYQIFVPVILILGGLFIIIACILFALFYLVKYMEKCAKLLILKMKNKEVEKDGN